MRKWWLLLIFGSLLSVSAAPSEEFPKTFKGHVDCDASDYDYYEGRYFSPATSCSFTIQQDATNDQSKAEPQKSSGIEQAFCAWAGQWLIKLMDDPIALFTLALTISTGLLWLETRRLAKGSIDAANLANKEFVASHRPLLVIHSVALAPLRQDLAPEKQPLRVEFAIVNAGTGVGTVTGSAVYLQCINFSDRLHLPKLSRNDIIAQRIYEVGATDNGASVESDIGEREDFAKATVEAVAFNFETKQNPAGYYGRAFPGKTLCFHGWVAYADESANVRTTYFRRVFSFSLDRFIKTGDPDDENTY